MRSLAILACSLLLTACAAASGAQTPPIEAIYGLTATKAGVTVRLASNGCTKKSDLTVAVRADPARPLLLVARKHPDPCRSFVAGHTEVTWSYEELGLKPGDVFVLANPITADPSP